MNPLSVAPRSLARRFAEFWRKLTSLHLTESHIRTRLHVFLQGTGLEEQEPTGSLRIWNCGSIEGIQYEVACTEMAVPEGVRARSISRPVDLLPFEASTRKLVGSLVLTGDRDFDERVRVRGNEPWVRSILGSWERRQVGRIVQAGLLTTHGAFVELALDLEAGQRARQYAVREFVIFSRSLLGVPSGIPQALAVIASQDPSARVRLNCLTCLQEHYAGSPVVSEASRAALDDADPAIRLRGARWLGEEGCDALVAILRGWVPNARSMLEPATRAEAVRCLAEQAPPEKAAPEIEKCLADREVSVRRACALALGSLHQESSIPLLLCRLDKDENDPSVQVALVAALGSMARPDLELCLQRYLRSGLYHVRVAAVRALMRTGTVRSIPALLEVRGELRQEARAAVDLIRARFPSGEPGELAISPSGRSFGDVAVCEESGKVSLAADEDARGIGSPNGPAGAGRTKPRNRGEEKPN